MRYGPDFLVIAAYFIAIVWVGLSFSRKSRTVSQFSIGDRQIPWWAVLGSILAAEISAATFLGAPGEGYGLRNFTYAQLAIGTLLARVIVSYVFIKPYYDYRVISIYEFLHVRFGVRTKNAASAVFLFTRILASGSRLYIAAVVLVLGYEMLTGAKPTLRQELLIYIGSLVLLTLFTTLYTSLGGIKAVVWTDVIQAAVMFGSLAFAIWMLLRHIPGGWHGALSCLKAPGDLSVFDTGIDATRSWGANFKYILKNEYTLWAAFFASTFITMATHGTDQDMVQRMLTAKNYHRSRLAVVLSGLADIPLVMVFLLVGILLWAFYRFHPDPNLPDKNPYIFAYYILHELPVGVRGLLIAGIFATAMGSLSTALNALATSFIQDWYLPYLNPAADETSQVRALRWSTVVFAIALIVVGSLTALVVLTVKDSRIIPIVLGIFAYTYGPLLGVFLVGMLTRSRGNEAGNLPAMLSGFLAVTFFSGLYCKLPLLFGRAEWTQPHWLPAISFPWWITIGTCVTFGIAVLFRTPASQQDLARRHVASANPPFQS
ncbi:MAG: sodium:solute symporter [Methylacidiphilales bacterium]|nr:sodium:solute symporter [Candidatus Methylacidiphilales bacterium]